MIIVMLVVLAGTLTGLVQGPVESGIIFAWISMEAWSTLVQACEGYERTHS